jgi:hypothetical protein
MLLDCFILLCGGAERDRTVGLLNAIQALSQLSYSPTEVILKNYYTRICSIVKKKIEFMRPDAGGSEHI